MPDEVRVLTRNETEQYIIKERFAKQYSSVDGGWEARFRLAQGSMAGQLAHASDPVKNAELAGALNSLRAFSGEFAKYAENRAVYVGAKQIYDEYIASGAYDGSMLVPAEINGEKVRIKAENLADIAYVCEQRIRNAVKSRSAAAQQEFGAERVSGGVDFYSLSTPECADAVLGFSENIASGKAPEGAVQAAFAALNRQVAEKRAGREIPREALLENSRKNPHLNQLHSRIFRISRSSFHARCSVLRRLRNRTGGFQSRTGNWNVRKRNLPRSTPQIQLLPESSVSVSAFSSFSTRRESAER